MTEPHVVYPGGGTAPPEQADPAHADPADETADPDDYGPGPGGGDPDAGQLPEQIPETDQVWPPGEGEG